VLEGDIFVESYLKRRGKFRLRVLSLLLNSPKGDFIPIKGLKNAHLKLFKTELSPGNMYVFHKDGLIEFQKTMVDSWEYSKSTTNEMVFVLSGEDMKTYEKDSVRIVPEKFDSINEQVKLITSLTDVGDVQMGNIQLELPFENLSNEILVIRAAAFLSSLFNGGEITSKMIIKVVNEGFLGDTNLKRNPDSLHQSINNVLEMDPNEIPGEFAGFALIRKENKLKWIKLENH
jgi:hypothetical protein